MGAAVSLVAIKVGAWLGSGAFSALVARTILINVALGALTFEADGDVWVAVDE